jgi:hypothetical protein
MPASLYQIRGAILSGCIRRHVLRLAPTFYNFCLIAIFPFSPRHAAGFSQHHHSLLFHGPRSVWLFGCVIHSVQNHFLRARQRASKPFSPHMARGQLLVSPPLNICGVSVAAFLVEVNVKFHWRSALKIGDTPNKVIGASNFERPIGRPYDVNFWNSGISLVRRCHDDSPAHARTWIH